MVVFALIFLLYIHHELASIVGTGAHLPSKEWIVLLSRRAPAIVKVANRYISQLAMRLTSLSSARDQHSWQNFASPP